MEIQVSDILKPRRKGSKEVEKVLKKDRIKVYLSGPITFAEEMQEYRAAIAEGLTTLSKKFVIHDPRLRENNSLQGSRFYAIDDVEEKRELAETVILGDLEEILGCDLVVAYIFKPIFGTAMEIFWMSRILKRPVILVYTQGAEQEIRSPVPLWLYGHANLIFQSKKGLFNWLKKALEESEEQ